MSYPMMPSVSRTSRREKFLGLSEPQPPLNATANMFDNQTSMPLFSSVKSRLEYPNATTRSAAQTAVKTRKGKRNYCSQDITTLLDIIGEVLPLGPYMWSLAEKEFKFWAVDHGRPKRDQDFLKGKLEKLVSTKKCTSDPHCPPNVRRAKTVSKQILRECSAITVGEDQYEIQSDQSLEESNEASAANTTHAEAASLRARIQIQLRPAKTIKKQKDPTVECMQDVAQSMLKISSSLAPQFTENDLQKLVRDEVEKATMETKKSKHKEELDIVVVIF